MQKQFSFSKAVKSLKTHDHICVVYETRKKWLATLISFMRTGLKQREKCLYIGDAHTTKQARKTIQKEAFDLRSAQQSGQIALLSKGTTDTREDSFDPDRTIALLISETKKALSEGYTALRVIIEPVCWKENGFDPGKLSDFVSSLSQDLFPRYPCLALFLYDRRKLDPGFVTAVMLTHMLAIRETPTYADFFPMLEDELSKGHFVARPIELWLDTFKRGKRTKKSIEFLSDIIDHSLQPIAFSYTDGHLLANRAVFDLLGIKESDFSMVRGGEYYTPLEWVPVEIKAMIELHRTLKPVRYEKEIVRKDGKKVPVEVLVELRNDDKGKPVYVGWATDLTTRKAHENMLRESEERYRQIADVLKREREHLEEVVTQRTQELRLLEMLSSSVLASLPEHIVVTDKKGAIIEVNEAWKRFAWENGISGLGCVAVGANYLKVCRRAIREGEQSAEAALCGIESVLKGITGEFSMEYDCSSPVEQRWFVMKVLPLKVPGGGAVIAHTDVTQRRKAEENIQHLERDLQQASRIAAMGELTAALAHELNQPLTGILSNAQAVQQFLLHPKPDLAEIRESLSYILEDAERTCAVVSGLRSLFRGEGIKFEALDMNDVIREVCPLIHSHALLNSILFVEDLDPGILPVSGSRIQLQQVLLNLVSNAIEAMRHSSLRRLQVRTEMDAGEWVRVKVEDSGAGVDDKRKEDIFKPFVTTKKEGMGMGLAISKSIIGVHRGKIWMEKNTGPGTTFYFTLPVKRSSSP